MQAQPNSKFLLFLTLFSFNAWSQPPRVDNRPTLHAIYILDTHAANIGATVERDVVFANAIRAAFAQPALRNYRLSERRLSARSVTPDHISEVFRNIRTRTNDAVFVYVSSHGMQTQDGDPYFTFKYRWNGTQSVAATDGANLRRSVLIKMMLARHVRSRLGILFSDSCALTARRPRPQGTIVHMAFRNPPTANARLVKQLFFDSRGFMDINSSTPGNCAYSDNAIGGFATHAATQAIRQNPAALDSNNNGQVSPTEFFSNVNTRLQTLLNPKRRETQQLHTYHNSRPQLRTKRKLRFVNNLNKRIRVDLCFRTVANRQCVDTFQVRLNGRSSQVISRTLPNNRRLIMSGEAVQIWVSDDATRAVLNNQHWASPLNLKDRTFSGFTWLGYRSSNRETTVFELMPAQQQGPVVPAVNPWHYRVTPTTTHQTLERPVYPRP